MSHAPLYTTPALAAILGARLVEAMPDDIAPSRVRRWWRCAVDKLRHNASDAIPVLCVGGGVMAWRVDPEAYREDADG